LLRGDVGSSTIAPPSIVACFLAAFAGGFDWGVATGATPAPTIVAWPFPELARPSVAAASFGTKLLACFALGGRVLLRLAATGAPKRGEVMPAAAAITPSCSPGRWALMLAAGCCFTSGAVIIIVP
jgi:hypothetical protein